MSGIIDPHSLENTISGLISAKKQIFDSYLDLTIGKLYRLKNSGQLDFGGSEFQPAQVEPCFPVKRNAEDNFGWWTLHEGYYLIEFNESFQLSSNQIAVLQPHPHLLANGCSHPNLLFRTLNSDFRCPIWIPKIGIQIKENSRISRVWILEF
ncbi:MAG: deoxycytidine triphosphate deaminase [Calditrichia bacterium]